MTKDDNELFLQNVRWFNQFFDDLLLLLGKISDALGEAFPEEMSHGQPSYTYPKSNSKPSIPAYHVMGLRGKGCIVQVFTVLNPRVIEKNPAVSFEPSLIVVQHTQRNNRAVYGFTLRFVQNQRIVQEQGHNGVFSGHFEENPAISFHGFQIPFSAFAPGKDIDQAIQEQVIERLMPLIPVSPDS